MTFWWLRLAGGYARPHWASLTLIVCLTLAGAALNALEPWPLKLIVDSVLADEPIPAAAAWIGKLPGAASSSVLIAWLTLGTVALFLASWASRMLRAYVQSEVASRMVYALGADVFGHLQRLSLSFHGKKQAGDLVKRVTNDNRCVQELIIEVLVPLFTSLANLTAMFIIMWQLDSTLSLLALCAAPGLILCMRLFAPQMEERKYEELRLQGEMMALAEQTLAALPVVQAFDRERHEDGRFSTLTWRTGRAFLRNMASQVRFSLSTSTVTALGRATIIVFGGLHVLQGELTLGGLLVFLSYLNSLYGPLYTLAHVSSGYATAAAGARRVFEVLDTSEDVQDAPEAKPIPKRSSRRRGHVVFENVTFGYEPDQPVLQGATLEVHPGETVALAGHSGAGKSTLASLIPRLFDPWEGRVLFDGLDVKDVRLASLRSQIAIVPQEPFLLPLSVAENIAYGRPEASREDVIRAALTAEADSFIRRLPQGYDTVIGERGVMLSGGERQRLAIARALLKDAPVLILDEPTSALDATTEASLLEALDRLSEGRTTFLIAHRPSTVRRADRVVVLDAGRAVEIRRDEERSVASGDYGLVHSLQPGYAAEFEVGVAS